MFSTVVANKEKNHAKGYSEAVERLRKMQKEKEAIASAETAKKRPDSWYQQTNKKTEVKPFHFQLDKRVRNRPLLYLDINMGPGKMGRIGIHEGDEPRILALNFAQSYKLDTALTNRLEDLIRENMVKNNVPLFNSTPRKASLVPSKSDAMQLSPEHDAPVTKIDIQITPEKNHHPQQPQQQWNDSTSATQRLLNSLNQLKEFARAAQQQVVAQGDESDLVIEETN